jgi:sigma-B regulation protein RsbU (phosphoserine phosphatase)
MAFPEPPQPSGDRLALLYRLSQTFNSSLDLEEVLNTVMDEAIAATRAERGFVMLYDSSGQLTFQAARGLDQRTIEDPRFQVSRSVIEKVAREGQPILTSNAQTDNRFNMRESVMILGLRSILCVPLQTKAAILGIVYVDNRLQAGIFTHADLELLTFIAASASIAIENARLYQVAVEKGRMERELQMARRVQSSLLPASTPELPGWEIACRWIPAREVSGDYFDFIEHPDGGLGMVIADVTDKGMHAALFMAASRSIVRASVFATDTPAEAITQANRVICADSSTNLFVTLVYAHLDSQTGRFTYVNAGHNPPLAYQAGPPAEIREISGTGMLLGVQPEVDYQQQTLTMQPGDFILLYTDGINEAVNPAFEEYGTARMMELAWKNAAAPAGKILDRLLESVEQFAGDAAPYDDITLILIKRHTA